MTRTRGKVILNVHVPIFSLEQEGLIATAPTLNSNVTQQSLALGVLGTPQSHDLADWQGRGKLRDAPSALKTSLCLSRYIHILHRLISQFSLSQADAIPQYSVPPNCQEVVVSQRNRLK
jgi:hypothetical protein